jgi:hypothetical protein
MNTKEHKMKVYSLLGFVDYEGSNLVGVFGSVEDVIECVESGNGNWYYHDMGYVESELGEKIDDVLMVVEYVNFKDFRFKVVDKV